MKSLVKKVMPNFMLRILRKFYKNESNYKNLKDISESLFYKTYESVANPVYHPHLEKSEFSQVLTQVQKDVNSEINHDPYGRSILFNLLRHVENIRGDVIEFGVHHGGGSHLMGYVLDRYNKKNKTLWCLDSFEGLSEPGDNDIDVRSGEYFFKKNDLNNVNFSDVKDLLQKHACEIKIVKGWIPDSLSDVKSRVFSFAHIDVDLYQPILDSLNFVYKKMSKGGVILLDDYGFPMLLGAKRAVDEFFRDKNEVVMPLPTGQAVVFKQKPAYAGFKY